jgi:hypothetical protein
MECEFVLEFVVRHVVCRNTAVQSSPLIVTLPGCLPVTLNCRSATIATITLGQVKRVTFGHSHLLNLKTSFVLVHGHGDPSVRASCSFDFFANSSCPDDATPFVYNVEIGMDRPDGDRFGVLNIVYQLMPLSDFEELMSHPIAPRNSVPGQHSPPTSPGRRISVTKRRSPGRSPRSRASGVELPSLSPTGSSIHDRYLRRNELWIGTHSSTHTRVMYGGLGHNTEF